MVNTRKGFKLTSTDKDNQISELKEELTKATKIIKQLMYASRDCIAWYCLCDKAKQYIKEIEK